MAIEPTTEQYVRIEAEEKKRAILEEKRINALSSRDASTYSRLCDELGVTPEDSELVDMAEADKIYSAQHDLKSKEALLKMANGAYNNPSARINFLRSQGIEKVYVQGARTVVLTVAPEKNVYAAYMRVKEKLEQEVREMRTTLE